MISARSFRTLGCTLSGPGDFAIFNDSIIFLILSFEIFTSFNTASNFFVGTSGISCIFSFVKTLGRMMTALQPFLYHSWCFFLPHLLQSKRGRVFLGVSWSCHWHIARTFYGLHLASFAMLLSLCLLAFFVRFLTWFDSLLYSLLNEFGNCSYAIFQPKLVVKCILDFTFLFCERNCEFLWIFDKK